MYAIESCSVYILNMERASVASAEVSSVCSQIHKASNQQVFFFSQMLKLVLCHKSFNQVLFWLYAKLTSRT